MLLLRLYNVTVNISMTINVFFPILFSNKWIIDNILIILN